VSVQAQRVVGNGETPRLGYCVLAVFDLGIVKLFDPAAV